MPTKAITWSADTTQFHHHVGARRYGRYPAPPRGQHLAQLEGNWDLSRDLSDRSLDLLPLDRAYLGLRMWLEYELGDFAKGSVYWERLSESHKLGTSTTSGGQSILTSALAIVGRISGEDKWPALVAENVGILLESPSQYPVSTAAAVASLGLLAVTRGDATAAREQYVALEARRGALLAVTTILSDRMFGLLAHVMGDLDLAAEHFEDALAFCRKAGYRPELAWTCCDYADTLLQRDAREKATSLLDESLAISSELGMRPLMERVLSRREILGA